MAAIFRRNGGAGEASLVGGPHETVKLRLGDLLVWQTKELWKQSLAHKSQATYA